MAKRRYAADGVAGGGARFVGVSAAHGRGAGDSSEPRRAEPVRPGYETEDGPAVGEEDEGLHDLPHGDTHGAGGGFGRAGAFGELADLDAEPKFLRGVGEAL